LRGPDQLIWLTRLEGEHDNLRAALAWTLESGEIELGVALAGAVWPFLRLRGYWQEGRRWLDEVLKRDEFCGRPTSGVTRARALLGGGQLAVNLSQFEPATRYLAECLRLYRDAGDRFGEARALDVIGSAAKDQFAYQEAYASHEAGLSIMRNLGDRWGIASVLGSLARTSVEAGDYPQAVAWGTESAALRRELGDIGGLATALGDIGQGLYYQGQYARAAEFVTQSLALYRRLNMPVGTAFGLLHLTVLALLQGENERAAPLVAESLALFHRSGVKWGITGGLSGSAWVFSRLGHVERAARLLGADSFFREWAGLTAGPGDRPILDGTIAEVRAQLQPDRFTELWEEGRSMPLEEAVAEALSVGDVGRRSPCGPTETATLTPREREVAALIARGFANRQIATNLGTSHETVRIHVRHILKKLGVASRHEVADWARERVLTLSQQSREV
jgi:DNA-binding CsgD family transcriptional regulator/tetratricopeptide (TPR) repeat protein